MIANRTHYLNRCRELQAFLKHAETMPSHIIATQCLCVMRNIYGSKFRVAMWVFRIAMRDAAFVLKCDLWRGWQRYVMLRTEAEIDEMVMGQGNRKRRPERHDRNLR